MTILKDYSGRKIRLTDERLAHILDHPEMADLQAKIGQTLSQPELVVESLSDSEAHLYYRFDIGTQVGDKFLCVVVKINDTDAFILTAYLTDQPKKGKEVWKAKS